MWWVVLAAVPPLYRFLNKCGFSIMTGVLHKNDIDYHVGKALGARIIGEKALKKSVINPSTRQLC